MVRNDNNFYSFDIFDTLITRETANPRGIFSLMQNTLNKSEKYRDIPNIVKENFYNLRIESEFFIRDNKRHSGIKEVTIDNIYDFIAQNIPLTTEQRNDLLNLELKTERDNIIAIQKNIERVENLIKSNKKVILISDMYLPSNFIREVLSSINKIFETIPIYVSCEHNCTKKSGELYKYIQSKENVQKDTWYHFGDNIQGDVVVPRNLGITAELYEYVKLNPFEIDILRRFPEDAYINLAVGCAKNCRLFADRKNNEKYNLGASLGGCLLYPYIAWMVEQVKLQNLKRLYFVMRDGEVLKILYDILAKKHNLPTLTKLIYGSREAWRAPSINKNNPNFEFMFASRREINTVRKIAARFHISLNNLIKILPERFNKIDRVFTNAEFDDIKSFLMHSNDFLTLVERENTEQRELIKAYITQEMDLSDDKFAIVDLAASGRTQMCFVSILNEVKDMTVRGFYAQFNGLKINDKKFKMSAFFTTAKVKSWLELFCRSECGYTKYYQKKNNKIVPILEELEGKALKAYSYAEVIAGEKDFCDKFYESLLKNPLVCINYRQFIFYLDYIAQRPTSELANIIGDMPFSNYYGLKDKVYLCAPKITLKDLIFGYDKTQIQLPKLSYIRSSKQVKKIIDINNKYGSLRKFLIDIYFSKSKKNAYIRLLGVKISFNWKG